MLEQPRILLINPWIYDFTAYDLWSKPLGLLYIAAFLRQAGLDLEWIDCLDKYYPGAPPVRVKKYGTGHYHRQIIESPDVLKSIPRRFARYGIPEEYFIDRLKAARPVDAVLVTSMMTYWYPGVQHAVRLVRRYLPDVPVILGGIYATILPQHAREIIQPDYIIEGPGEWQTWQLLSEILGLNESEIKQPAHLDDYPYPAFDLINHPDYLVNMTARGCPYDCSFCAQKKIAMPYARRDPEAVVQEFTDHYNRFGLRDFAFYDDALFIARDRHIKMILEGLIRRNMPLRLHSPNGLFAREIDAELAGLMYRGGFRTVRLSFETANEQRREDMNAKVNNVDMIRAVEHLTAAGYDARGLETYVLMGLPGQDLEEIVASMLFVHQLGIQVRLASFSPIPGTLEFERAVEQGRIAADVDPLLTNKSIFPLRDDKMDFATYRSLRTLSGRLNEAARKDQILFRPEDLTSLVAKIRE